MAKAMKLTSVEVSASAAELYRQGLSDIEVEKRLVSASQFAKVAKMSVQEAVDVITVSINTGLVDSAQRATDVLVKLGDAAATDADEVAKAIQRSASVAKEAGVDFEHLATWITVISERTRLAPEVIGTSLQSVLARLHQMRSSGFSEDGISTNMIEDAMRAISNSLEINLSLFKEGTQEWKPAQEVLEDIAAVWYDMTDVQRSYLTTMMAGTRQQDRFINLMKGMADETEGMSRYQELLNVAMTAGGATRDKYEIWLESVTAAQNKFRASIEHLYHVVGASEAVKGLYETFGKLLGLFADGVSATGGVTLLIAGIAGIGVVIARVINAIKIAKGLAGFLMKGKIGLIITTLAAAIGGVNMLIGALSPSKKEEPKRELSVIDDEMKSNEASYNRHSTAAKKLINELEEIKKEQGELSSSGKEYRKVIESLIVAFPELEDKLKNQNGTFVTVKEAIDEATKSLKNYDEAFKNTQYARAIELVGSASDNLEKIDTDISRVKTKIANAEKTKELLSDGMSFDVKPIWKKFLERENGKVDYIPTYFGRQYDVDGLTEKFFSSDEFYKLVELSGIGVPYRELFKIQPSQYGGRMKDDHFAYLQAFVKDYVENQWNYGKELQSQLDGLQQAREELLNAYQTIIGGMFNDLDNSGKDYYAKEAREKYEEAITSGLKGKELTDYMNKVLGSLKTRADEYAAGNQDEVQAVRESMVNSIFESIGIDEKTAQAAIAKMDSDGVLGRVYDAYMAELFYKGEEKAKASFEASNASGTWTEYVDGRKEAILALEALQPRLDKLGEGITAEDLEFISGGDGWDSSEVDKLRTMVDLVKNGKVSAEEFVEAIKSGGIEAFDELISGAQATEISLNEITEAAIKTWGDYQLKLRGDNFFVKELTELRNAYVNAPDDKKQSDLNAAMLA